MAKSFWTKVTGKSLGQGDLLIDCLVPQFEADFGAAGEGATETLALGEQTLIIVTQSCDLENSKVDLVAMCPAYTLEEFETTNPKFKNKDQWENVRKGRVPGLHLLGSPCNPDDNRSTLVVDFGQNLQPTPGYLERKADAVGERLRLDSPFLEHFSQAFARYFMRVGLPSQIPAFK